MVEENIQIDELNLASKHFDSTVWVEKYRPKTFDAVRGQELIVKKVKAFVELKNIPHLLFAGPAGVGKSTLALVIARQFFGENLQQNFLGETLPSNSFDTHFLACYY